MRLCLSIVLTAVSAIMVAIYAVLAITSGSVGMVIINTVGAYAMAWVTKQHAITSRRLITGDPPYPQGGRGRC